MRVSRIIYVLRREGEKGIPYHKAIFYRIRRKQLHKSFQRQFLTRISKHFHTNNKINKFVFEINMTNDCNLKCPNCCSSCPQAPDKSFISVNQVKRFLKENEKVKTIKLYGGEPSLHPHFFEIIKILKEYKKKFPKTKIVVLTNGQGKEVKENLNKIPKEMRIFDSSEDGLLQKVALFESYNEAPCDDKKYKNANFSKGCWRISMCGLCISKSGYYVCSPGYHIDRVFGLDIGIKDRKDLTEKNMRNQLKKLCPLCGLYKEPKNYVKGIKTSSTWKKAYSSYKKKKPVLSEY